MVKGFDFDGRRGGGGGGHVRFSDVRFSDVRCCCDGGGGDSFKSLSVVTVV